MSGFLQGQYGQYEINGSLGEGGMGIVYKGVWYSPAPGGHVSTPVAIKMLLPSLAKEPKIRERFFYEAEAHRSLQHNNIVQFIEFLEYAGNYFIIMELVDGIPIDSLLQAKGVLSSGSALHIIWQVLDALEYTHSHSPPIVHRDIKPSNILIDISALAKLTDFGIARIAGTRRLTSTGAKVGTLWYMPPEQIKGLDVDHRADIYALGITLYEMVTGNVPFDGKGEYEICSNIIKKEPVPPSYFLPQIDSRLEKIIMKAIVRSPVDRFQSAATFKEEIIQFLPSQREGVPHTIVESQQSSYFEYKASHIPKLQMENLFENAQKLISPIINKYSDMMPKLKQALGSYLLASASNSYEAKGHQAAFKPSPPISPVRTYGTIMALGGTLAGSQFVLEANGLRIGRDSNRCQVVVPDDNISGKHAWIVPLNEQVTLIDLNSTNGTFLNRQRISGRVVLKNDDVFQLGSMGANSFVFKSN